MPIDALYPYLHQFLIEAQDKLQANLSSQEALSKAIGICRRAASDPTPGENLKARYIASLLYHTETPRAAELILCLSWVILVVQEQPTYAVSTFAKQLQPLICHSVFFQEARQLAVTIRQRERHIKTYFLATPSPMKIEIEGNPGTGNSFTEVNIQHVENYNPAATTIVTKHYHFDGQKMPVREDAVDAAAEKMEQSAKTPQTSDIIDTTPIRTEILNYVSCLRPYLADDWKSRYMKVWDDILSLDIIEERVYNPGKQQGTNFNRNLVANIIHFFDSYGVYKDDYSATVMTIALEGEKDHPVRAALGKDPEAPVASRLRRYFTE